MTKLEQLLTQFRNEVGPEVIVTEIVGMDGIGIARAAIDPNIDTTEAAARFAMVAKMSEKVITKTGTGKIEDVLGTTDSNYMIARMLGDGTFFWAVLASRDATLGSIRMLMNEYIDQVWDAIPH